MEDNNHSVHLGSSEGTAESLSEVFGKTDDALNQWTGDMMVLQVLADSNAVNEQEREVLTRWMEASSPRHDEWVAQVVSSGPHEFPLLQWRSADVSFETPIGTKLYVKPDAINAELLEALKWHEQFKAREGDAYGSSFERVAEVFHRETGFLSPGKNCWVHSPEQRQAAWDEWIAAGIARTRAAIAKATS